MNDETLLKYLTEDLDQTESKQVEDWCASSKENEKLLEQLYYTLFVSDRVSVMNNINVDQAYSNFKKQVQNNRNREKPKRTKLAKLLQYAAVAVVAGALFFLGNLVNDLSKKVSQPFIVETGLGERTHITLPDGTVVWIGSCTRVEYSITSFANDRLVKLDGEAYFEVKNVDNQPFTVHSDELKIKVLGTKFNVRANPDESMITTTLLEGSVQIISPSMNSESIVMKPMEQFTYNSSTHKYELKACETATEYIGWIDGKLFFDRASLSDIAIGLERYYNVDITIADEKLEQEIFTCEFDTKDNIYQILSILKMTNKFDYNIENRQVTIVPKK